MRSINCGEFAIIKRRAAARADVCLKFWICLDKSDEVKKGMGVNGEGGLFGD
jgi:hypothetical protein